MLLTARRVAEAVAFDGPPPDGTGPLGAPGGARWVTAVDILRAVLDRPHVRDEVWMRSDDETVIERAYPERGTTTLWPHQSDAVHASAPREGVFRSGVHDHECGTGKTMIGGEIVRMSRAPTVVVTQHSISVEQWTAHFRSVQRLANVMSLADAREEWRVGRDPMPDALVLTYTCLARSYNTEPIILYARAVPFGILVLDEVHIAIADHFRLACTLRSRVALGLSGSLVREDQRLEHLAGLVGPVLTTHVADRVVNYTVVQVDVDDDIRKRIDKCKRRTRVEHALRTLNPNKLCALEHLVESVKDKRVLIFCDSPLAAPHVADIVRGTRPFIGVIDGRTPKRSRDHVISTFCATPSAVLVSTRVCDASIDFPKDLVIIQVHSASGSRQQEVQRCGRGLTILVQKCD